jgi:hypothetical protein
VKVIALDTLKDYVPVAYIGVAGFGLIMEGLNYQ